MIYIFLEYTVVIRTFLIFSALVKYFEVKNDEFKARSLSLPTYKLSVADEEHVSFSLRRPPKGLLHPLSQPGGHRGDTRHRGVRCPFIYRGS